MTSSCEIFLVDFLYAFPTHSMCTTCPAHLIILDVVALITDEISGSHGFEYGNVF
jgi:hypothetical protein